MVENLAGIALPKSGDRSMAGADPKEQANLGKADSLLCLLYLLEQLVQVVGISLKFPPVSLSVDFAIFHIIAILGIRIPSADRHVNTSSKSACRMKVKKDVSLRSSAFVQVLQ